MARQVNISHGTHAAADSGASGYGFDSSGQPTITDSSNVDTILQTGENNPSNIVANKGIGLEADLPSSGYVAGDTYITTDTFLIYIASDSVTWGSTSLVKGQLVTDVLNGTELPPIYQYYNSILMPIANYVVELPTLPE